MKNIHLICLMTIALILAHAAMATADVNQGIAAYERDDFVRANELLAPAADAGDAMAQLYLGKMYFYGWEGTPKDYNTAIAWFEKSVKQGNAEAEWALGYMYAKGKGVEKAPLMAAAFYTRSAKQGFAKAQYYLGKQYAKGEGVGKDMAKALELYGKSAEQGYDSAQFRLGYMYSMGKEVKQDLAKAVKWYKKAAEQGHGMALNNLGSMHQKGKGVKKDPKKAYDYYMQAVKKGKAQAMYNLGAAYETGSIVEKDNVKAYAWYLAAAEKGRDVQEDLDGVAKNMNQEQIAEAKDLAQQYLSGETGESESLAGGLAGHSVKSKKNKASEKAEKKAAPEKDGTPQAPKKAAKVKEQDSSIQAVPNLYNKTVKALGGERSSWDVYKGLTVTTYDENNNWFIFNGLTVSALIEAVGVAPEDSRHKWNKAAATLDIMAKGEGGRLSFWGNEVELDGRRLAWVNQIQLIRDGKIAKPCSRTGDHAACLREYFVKD